MDKVNGVILVDKPSDWTSQDVTAKIKRKLHVDKIGHAGTLDPLATGLLVVLVGSATKLSNYLMSEEKEYECEILIGKSSDTEDISGNIIDVKEVQQFNNVDDILNGLIGSLEQVPPMYSSIKQNGVKLYELAREGITVERNTRVIEIKKLIRTSELLYEDGCCKFKFKTTVSKGTYIRSLCVEIGKRLGYPALMNKLERTRSGNFCIEDSYTIENVINDEFKILSNYEAVKDKNIYFINEKLNKRVMNGMSLRLNSNEDLLYLVYNNELVGIYEKENEEYKAKRVWN